MRYLQENGKMLSQIKRLKPPFKKNKKRKHKNNDDIKHKRTNAHIEVIRNLQTNEGETKCKLHLNRF